jgi:hypothetical protein
MDTPFKKKIITLNTKAGQSYRLNGELANQ